MKNYFYLQLKRVSKVLPFVIVLTVALLITLTAILGGMFENFFSSEKNQKYTVAVAGDTDNNYFKLGLSAMQSFDETKFSIEFKEMSEKKAQKAMENGEVEAYIIIPKDFVENALSGDVDPITFVTSAGMEGVSGLFKKEITALVTDMVIYSQKGTYGLYDALSSNGLSKKAGQHMDKISIQYAELIFQRNRLYSVEELGVSDGLSTPQYYVCAVMVLMLVLVGLPFGSVYIRKDYSLNRLQLSRGYPVGRQVICEYLAYLIAMLLLTGVALIVVVLALRYMPAVTENVFPNGMPVDFIAKILPIVIMISAFNMMMFSFSGNIVSGLLLHFFALISMCYVSGCMYPIYVFPDIIKKIGTLLPTGIARAYLATSFTYDNSFDGLIGLLVYSGVFLAVAWLVRLRKTARVGG